MKKRCEWAGSDPLYVEYHDCEWGVPQHDDRHLFEMLVLEGAQAGLSWLTILRKRQNFRRAFADFEPAKVARFSEKKIQRLLQDEGIVRNRAKVRSAVGNAAVYLEIQREFGSFDTFIWELVGGRPKINRWTSLSQVPASTDVSKEISRELKGRGMNFVGPTICYAFMQAVGLVNDHVVDCHRYRALGGKR